MKYSEKSITISTSLPVELVNRIDQFIAKNKLTYRSRSHFFQVLTEKYLNEKELDS